jgi:hypothetical protein
MSFQNGEFNPATRRYFNSATGKWVVRLRPTSKGKQVGKRKGRSIELRYAELGCPKSTIQIPVNTDISLIKNEAERRSLNYEHCLFILHKLLYNRIRLRSILRNDKDYSNNFTPLGSVDLYKWLGKRYVRCLQLLLDLSCLTVKLSSSGKKSYWNGGEQRTTSVYKISDELFSRSLFDHHQQFKIYEVGDAALNIKLHKTKTLNAITGSPTVQLLTKALRGIKVSLNLEALSVNHLPETVQEMQFLSNDINNGNIYVKPELDEYGNRFHSTFTFTWSALRPLIYFEGKHDGTTYIDLSNSQYYFFSQLSNINSYRLIPEYLTIAKFIKEVEKDDDFRDFCSHANDGTLYNWCHNSYKLSKTDLMKIFFGSRDQFKTKRNKLKWLVVLISQIQNAFGSNVLPQVLQRLESRTLLDRVCFTFLAQHQQANLISIHDGVLIETEMAGEFKRILSETFSQIGFPVPVFKEINY